MSDRVCYYCGKPVEELPPTIEWKRDYLALSNQIEEFQKRHLTNLINWTPPIENPSQGNVGRLLQYYLNYCREMLWAEVNGGLDEDYQEEIDEISKKFDRWEN